MFPLISWKEQAICLQKLQAVVITFSLLNFLEEYLSKTDFNDTNFLALPGNVHGWVLFFSRCIHKMCSYEEVPGYTRSGAPLWTQKQHIFAQ